MFLLFRGNSDFTLFVIHFIFTWYRLCVNMWSFFKNVFDIFSLFSQYGISTMIKGFFSSNISGGIRYDSSCSFSFSFLLKSLITLSTYLFGKSAVENFFLIKSSSSPKCVAILFDRTNYIALLHRKTTENRTTTFQLSICLTTYSINGKQSN